MLKGKGSPSLTIKSVLLDENIDDLEAFHEFCEKVLKADNLNISIMKINDHAQFSLKYCDNINEIFESSKTDIYDYADPALIVDKLGDLLEKKSRSACSVTVYPSITNKDQLSYFMDKRGVGVYKTCYHPRTMSIILPDGTVTPCLSYNTGNVKDTDYDILKIINNEKYTNFCDTISKAETNIPACCNLCCFLHVRD